MASFPTSFASSLSPHQTSKFRSPLGISLPCRNLWVSGRKIALCPIKALKKWAEYEDAVKEKDLGRALRFLKSMESERVDSSISESPSSSSSPGSSNWAQYYGESWRPDRDWEVLDTCLNADDVRLVGSAYAFLQERGFLPNFGKFRNIVLEGTRDVTPTFLFESTGLEASKLAPKKWGLSGSSSLLLIGSLGGVSLLLSRGIDIRPNVAAVLALGMLDAAFLGGSCLAQILCFWPPYRRRVLVHEAGHLLVAYLMGCPIRGVVLDPIIAMQMGIQGQAGTQFWDEKLDNELAKGLLSSTSFDRYCLVLFAGIASEALIYGEAEGGENDENLFRRICAQLQPPLNLTEMSNRARWSVLQSYNLLKWHKNALNAAVKALEGNFCLSFVIRRIEDAISSC